MNSKNVLMWQSLVWIMKLIGQREYFIISHKSYGLHTEQHPVDIVSYTHSH